MADPARIKTVDTPERASSAKQEQPHIKSEETKSITAKSTDGSKDSSSKEQPKQELKSVRCKTWCQIIVIYGGYNKTITNEQHIETALFRYFSQ